MRHVLLNCMLMSLLKCKLLKTRMKTSDPVVWVACNAVYFCYNFGNFMKFPFFYWQRRRSIKGAEATENLLLRLRFYNDCVISVIFSFLDDQMM